MNKNDFKLNDESYNSDYNRYEYQKSPVSDSPIIYNSEGVRIHSNKKRNFLHKKVLEILE